MKSQIYEYLKKHRGVGHTQAAAVGVKNSEALLVMATESEAIHCRKEYGIDCIAVSALNSQSSGRPIICDNGAIVDEIEALHALIEERSELLMEISNTHSAAMKEAIATVKRRKK